MRPLTKALPALRAFVGVLSHVGLLVCGKIGFQVEAVTTVCAGIQFLLCVCSDMIYKLTADAKGFPTIGAFIGFLSSVASLVRNQVGSLMKSFPTI